MHFVYDFHNKCKYCICTEWHLATQILYFIGALLLLFAEIFARAQLCCDERKLVYWVLAAVVLASGKIITAATHTDTGEGALFSIS